MVVTCDTCNRTFNVDEKRVAKVAAAKCMCGARVAFHADAIGNGSGGQRLGKYILLQRIAVGGMGEIFHGKIPGVEGFEREVAIKKMLPHLSQDRSFIEMMIKEAKLTVLLHHPNIVQVYDLAKEGKDYFIAMEYVPGVTVGHLLELSHRNSTLLPVEVAVHITMQVLRGLAYAHDLRGPDGGLMHVLHRDITPQNILVTQSAWVKITDFGIAKARNEISTTSPGMIKGKLGYIAPEQLAGGTPDHRLDIFCAGILLWETLAARRLFKGADEIDTFRLISEAKVPPLSKFRSDVSAKLEEAVRGALTRDPEDRFNSADLFYQALSDAISPRTGDEFQTASRRYFDENVHFFEGVATLPAEQPEVADHADDDTIEISNPFPDGEVSDISILLLPEKKSSSGAGKIAAIAAALLLIAGGVGFAVKDRFRSGPGPESGASIGGGRASPVIDPLTKEEVQLAVDGERARFFECYRTGGRRFRKTTKIEGRLLIPSTGGVASLTLQPKGIKNQRPGPCIEQILRALKFRPHSAKAFETTVLLPSPRETPLKVGSSGGSVKTSSSRQLTAGDIQNTLRKSSSSIHKCLNGLIGAANAPAKVDATITITTAGRVSRVDLKPRLPVAAVDQCLTRALKGLRFRNKPPKDVTVTIPLKIQVL